MSNILMLAGSPRAGGNTDDCVARAAENFRESGHEVATIRIADSHVRPCTGCRRCMELGRCVITDDDFEGIWNQVKSSDLLICAAPVYWMGPPGPLKNFIDRTHGYYAHRLPLEGLRAALLSVAADGGCWEPHEKVMGSWLRHYGARMLPSTRVLARGKGEAMGDAGTVEKLDEWTSRLAAEF